MSTNSRQSSSARHGVSVSRLTASTSASVIRHNIRSRSSTPTSDAKVRTISGSSVSRRNATCDIARWFLIRNSTVARCSAERPEAIEHVLRHAHALGGVVFVAPLADVVKQQRQDKQLGRLEVLQQGRKPLAIRRRPRGQALEVLDRQQRVLVDGVLVEEVAHHAARDGLERRKHTPEDAAIVHLREARVQAGGRAQKAQQRRLVRVRGEEVLDAESFGVLADEPEGRIGDVAAGIDSPRGRRRATSPAALRPAGHRRRRSRRASVRGWEPSASARSSGSRSARA